MRKFSLLLRYYFEDVRNIGQYREIVLIGKFPHSVKVSITFPFLPSSWSVVAIVSPCQGREPSPQLMIKMIPTSSGEEGRRQQCLRYSHEREREECESVDWRLRDNWGVRGVPVTTPWTSHGGYHSPGGREETPHERSVLILFWTAGTWRWRSDDMVKTIWSTTFGRVFLFFSSQKQQWTQTSLKRAIRT